MGLLTRRHALHGAAALLAALAGCSGSASMSSSTSPTATEPREPGDGVTTTPEHYVLRGTTSKPVVRTPSDEPTETDDAGREDRWRHRLVASAETAESLTLADVDGTEGARAFLAATAFETETIYVEERVVGECWELELCRVQWGSDRIETDYGRRLRPVDAACSAEKEVTVTTFIRLPDPIDPDEVTQYGSGSGSGRCRVRTGSRDERGTSAEAGIPEGN